MLSHISRRIVRYSQIRYAQFISTQVLLNLKWPSKVIVLPPLNKFNINVFCSISNKIEQELTRNEFERICEETLESLSDNLEILLESHPEMKGCDITFGDGVLTVSLGANGTYVINRQSPNKQIWLSSPNSGPKRYDFIKNTNSWVYKHDNVTLHSLLQTEFSTIFKEKVDLSKCAFYKD